MFCLTGFCVYVSTVISVIGAAGHSEVSFQRTLTEKEIADVDFDSWLPESVTVSPDGRRFAYVDSGLGRGIVFVDGKASKPYDGIGVGIVFSPDSRRVGYAAMQEGKWYVVTDSTTYGPYERLIPPITFSPDSRRIAFIVSLSGNGECVVLDGTAQTEYPKCRNAIFSPNGSRLAYAVETSDGWSVVLDGQKGRNYRDISSSSLKFSPDGRRFGYVAWFGERNPEFVVIDGTEYDGMTNFVFSPDSKRIAYTKWVGDVGGDIAVVVDNSVGDTYSDIRLGRVFSANSEHFAYVGILRDGEEVAVSDGKPGTAYDGIDLVFSPDGYRLALGVLLGQKARVVLDGIEGPTFDFLGDKSIVFSPDAKRLAYVGGLGEQMFVVLDGKEGKHYDGVQTAPAFSPDSRHVAYQALSGNSRFVVVDEHEGNPIDGSLKGSTIIWDSATQFHYLTVRGERVCLIEETLEFNGK